MSKQLIIGIGHKKRSGKDTLAEAIAAELLPRNTEILHFADPIYIEVATALGIPVDEVYDNKDFFRKILQWWGVDYRREYCKTPSYWIDKLSFLVEIEDAQIILIPGVRLLNEAEWIKSKDGLLIKISRPSLNHTDTHPSETALDNYTGWDMEVLNDGTEEQLLHKARGIVNSLIIPNL